MYEDVEVADVRARTGWELRVASDVTLVPLPSAEQIGLLRELG